MIEVARPYRPSQKKLAAYLEQIFERRWLTNGGPVVDELTERLGEYLGVENLFQKILDLGPGHPGYIIIE